MKPFKHVFVSITLLITATIMVAITHATPTINSSDNMIPAINQNQVEDQLLRKLDTKCHLERDHEACVRLKWFVSLSRVFKKSVVNVNDNVQITLDRESQAVTYDPDDDILLARSLDSDEETYALLVAGKLWRFIRSSTLHYKFSDNANLVVQSEPRGNLHVGVSINPSQMFGEGRGKNKGMMQMMMMMGTKMGIVGAIVLKGLFLLAGKALIVSKIALLLSVIIALKKLLSQKHIVEVPHHETHSSGWSRAFDGFIEGMAEGTRILGQDAQDMAFAGQKPAQPITVSSLGL